MTIHPEVISELQNNPVSGMILLCQTTLAQISDASGEWTSQEYNDLLEAYALMLEAWEADLAALPMGRLDISGDMTIDCLNLADFIRRALSLYNEQEIKLRFDAHRARFKASFGKGFLYEFSQGDLERLQNLINVTRTLIADARDLTDEHRQRLLRRLEKLQGELHKQVSDLDRFWGLVGDAGVVLGKLGSDAKPIVDRIREIADIIWSTQARAEELPSGMPPPLLGSKEPSE